ncbi:hypothetical protein Tco_0834300, partial [Tanacetum coccineum]
SRLMQCALSFEKSNCTSAIGSSLYMGLISALSTSTSFLDMLLVSYFPISVPLVSVTTKLASNALPISTVPFSVYSCLSFTLLSYSLLCSALLSIDFLTDSMYCKIARQILFDHPLSYALTATAYVPSIYLQQFWKTVGKVLDTEDTIRFKLDIQEIVYTVDMFCSTLNLLVKTTANPFIAPIIMKYIQPFMQIVGYQGDVDKVSAFFTKNLAQPWKTMFKVFNRCLTSRTSGHDKTKINILEIFHVVINRVHVDYAALLWWDFLHCVQQKKDQIQYPHFTKLIIANLMKKFSSIPQRIEEDYHFIKDDIPLVSVYTTGNVTVRGMLISDEFFTDDIRATKEYKEYIKVFVGKRKRKQGAGETSSPKPSLNIRVKQFKSSDSLIPPPSDDKERDEESYASEFVDSVFHDDDDSGNRIELEINKKNPKTVDDDDDEKEKQDDDNDDDDDVNDDDDDVNDDHTDHTLDKTQKTGSLETMNRDYEQRLGTRRCRHQFPHPIDPL